jgi:hypothetical protein
MDSCESLGVLYALRNQPGTPSTVEPETDPGAQSGVQPERAILCVRCAALITRSQHRIAMHGSHEHRFLNPAGLLFHIGCFSQAIGCTVVGPASDEYPWFPGFSWRSAWCGHCQEQLGWQFRGAEPPGFFGLILNRLRQATDES